MSNTTTSNATTPTSPALHSSLFLDRLILFLMPYFIAVTPDFEAASAEIVETLHSYGARTRSEMLNAVQIIAFSFAALDTIAEAKATADMSHSMRLRFHGCANNLSRSGQQNEKSLARRLDCDIPDAAKPAAEPANDISEAEIEDALLQAKAKIHTYCQRRYGTGTTMLPSRAPPAEEHAANNRPWGSAMLEALTEMGMPDQPLAGN